MVKPSEFTPRCSALLARMLGSAFGPDQVLVVQGDAALGAPSRSCPSTTCCSPARPKSGGG
jgi:coniferyl-aldehyde dehydrogenase